MPHVKEAKIQKWGNSNAIRITKDMLEEAGIDPSERLEVHVEKGGISFKPKNKISSFRKLFNGHDLSDGYRPESYWDDAPPVGRELI